MRACSKHSSFYRAPRSERERERENERERKREKEGGRERVRKREREREGERGGDRDREQDVEYGCFILIINRNDGCFGTLYRNVQKRTSKLPFKI